MLNRKSSLGSTDLLTFLVATFLLTATHAAAQTEKVLYSFGNDLSSAGSGLVFDAGGGLYGTAFGGDSGSVAYELTPGGRGVWTMSTLANLPNGPDSDEAPPLTTDSSGNLYGTLGSGGTFGGGTVFELMPAVGGSWSVKILYDFGESGDDASSPTGALILDSAGNLYGTTQDAGSFYGAVYELMPGVGGSWTEKVLYRFTANGEDGQTPNAGVVLDGAGNLYGTTSAGGIGYGTVFRLSPEAAGVWKEKILHRFSNNGKDGYYPYTGLTLDAKGNLYGSTSQGGFFGNGPFGGGTAFELIPSAEGGWGEKILHSFGNGQNGAGVGPLLLDATGNLYGVTYNGGVSDEGSVFKLSPSTGGKWQEQILYSFTKNSGDGAQPEGGLLMDSTGNLYGTTYGGGANGQGTVYEITP